MRTAEELMRGVRVFCAACKKGHHRYCSMSVHCECTNLEDGDASREEFDEYHRRMDKETDDGE